MNILPSVASPSSAACTRLLIEEAPPGVFADCSRAVARASRVRMTRAAICVRGRKVCLLVIAEEEEEGAMACSCSTAVSTVT